MGKYFNHPKVQKSCYIFNVIIKAQENCSQ